MPAASARESATACGRLFRQARVNSDYACKTCRGLYRRTSDAVSTYAFMLMQCDALVYVAQMFWLEPRERVPRSAARATSVKRVRPRTIRAVVRHVHRFFRQRFVAYIVYCFANIATLCAQQSARGAQTNTVNAAVPTLVSGCPPTSRRKCLLKTRAMPPRREERSPQRVHATATCCRDAIWRCRQLMRRVDRRAREERSRGLSGA